MAAPAPDTGAHASTIGTGERTARCAAAGAALFGCTGVAAGAFGAHALRGALDTDALAVFETAARYQLVHALALDLMPQTFHVEVVATFEPASPGGASCCAAEPVVSARRPPRP